MPAETRSSRVSPGSSTTVACHLYVKHAIYYHAQIVIAATVLWLRPELQDTPGLS
jgi:hypothetical protein